MDEFLRTDLRTATVVAAERVAGADKLLKLEVDLGGERRTLVAGIAQSYAPEEVVGRTVIVVANLKPAKIRGVESRGMVLAVADGARLRIAAVDGGPAPSGVRVK
jgi:methionyl-tRNA synthetase